MDIVYENHEGNEISLYSWPIMLQEPEILFGYEWKYDSNKRSISNFNKEIAEKTCTLSIFAESKEEYMNVMNMFMEVIEVDVLNETPGKIKVNGYYMSCFIIGSDLEEWEEDFYSTDKKIKIAAVNGLWIKETKIPFQYDDQGKDTSGKCYPHKYPYNYGLGGGYNSNISVEAFGSMDFIITIYGYAHNPEICIGENTYKVDYTVQSGEVLRIDSKNHSVLLTKTNGVTLSLFRYRGIRSYIFEKITSGELPVYWNGDFDWDILLLEERSEPKWT